MDEEKIEDMPEVEKAVNYICIKECFWNRLYKLGDSLTFKGVDPMLKSFKVKEEGGPVEEVLEDEGPKTLSEITKQEAQETIDSVNRGGLDVGSLDAGQAPVEDVVQTEEVPERGLAAEPSSEELPE